MKKQLRGRYRYITKNNEKNTVVLGQLKENIAKDLEVQLYTGGKRI